MTLWCPTLHLLRCALRVIRLVDPLSESRSSLSAAYASYPGDGAYSEDNLQVGEQILLRSGLLREQDGVLTTSAHAVALSSLEEEEAVPLLLQVFLSATSPPWLPTAASDVLRWEYVPQGVMAVLEEALPDPSRRDKLLLDAGRRFDDSELRELGGEGEEFVVTRCREYLRRVGRADLVKDVVRVSLVSDQMGYDVVSPDAVGVRWHLEVKTQGTRGPRPRIFLSRSEAQRGGYDPRWAVVVCRRPATAGMELLGWCGFQDLAAGLPSDSQDEVVRGSWVNVELTLGDTALKVGLPIESPHE